MALHVNTRLPFGGSGDASNHRETPKDTTWLIMAKDQKALQAQKFKVLVVNKDRDDIQTNQNKVYNDLAIF